MMNVEIYHGNALKPVDDPRLQSTDRDVVKDAKAHCLVGLGMVARRSHGAKGVLRFALDHGVHRRDDGTRSSEHSLA